MKHATKAAAFNFLIPGSGLWYLGKSWQAVVNFVVAALLTVIAFATGPDYLHWGLLAIAAGSSGLAHAAARSVESQSFND